MDSWEYPLPLSFSVLGYRFYSHSTKKAVLLSKISLNCRLYRIDNEPQWELCILNWKAHWIQNLIHCHNHCIFYYCLSYNAKVMSSSDNLLWKWCLRVTQKVAPRDIRDRIRLFKTIQSFALLLLKLQSFGPILNLLKSMGDLPLASVKAESSPENRRSLGCCGRLHKFWTHKVDKVLSLSDAIWERCKTRQGQK